jgi:hypothetical protein
MKLFNSERPSALPAGCALAPGATADAHAFVVGYGAVQRVRHLIQVPRQIQVQGRIPSTALTVQGSVMVADKRGSLGDVRGVPPRGRPV